MDITVNKASAHSAALVGATVGLAAILVGGSLGSLPDLWLQAGAGLLLSCLILRIRNAPSLLYLFAANFWLPIAADLLASELQDTSELIIDPAYRAAAISLSVAALLVMVGAVAAFKLEPDSEAAVDASLRSVVLLYVGSFVIGQILQRATGFAGGLSQIVLGMSLFRFVGLYILSSYLARANRWDLIAVIFIVEMAVGLTGYISSFQYSALIMMAGVASARPRIGAQTVLGSMLMLAGLVWLAMFWTAVKPEYRLWLNGGSSRQVEIRNWNERAEWLATYIADRDIDYRDAGAKLAARVGYTGYLAIVMQRYDQGLISPDLGLWLAGVQHATMPRFLFPDKPIVNDSEMTSLLTGEQFQGETSVSVGYLAQAFADFGYPMCLLPIAAVGLMLGGMNRYWSTRNVHPLLRSAFAATNLIPCFQYGSNIDKSMGGFVSLTISLILIERFFGSKIGRMLDGSRRRVLAHAA